MILMVNWDIIDNLLFLVVTSYHSHFSISFIRSIRFRCPYYWQHNPEGESYDSTLAYKTLDMISLLYLLYSTIHQIYRSNEHTAVYILGIFRYHKCDSWFAELTHIYVDKKHFVMLFHFCKWFRHDMKHANHSGW